MEMKITEYKNLLKSRLKEKRYNHSLCVADEAKRLALKYGADPDKAYLAGLLHDITKNSEEKEHFDLFSQYGVILSPIEKSSQKLWHAMSGSLYVKNILNIDDEEIILVRMVGRLLTEAVEHSVLQFKTIFNRLVSHDKIFIGIILVELYELDTVIILFLHHGIRQSVCREGLSNARSALNHNRLPSCSVTNIKHAYCLLPCRYL